jgi:hypothetical protein
VWIEQGMDAAAEAFSSRCLVGTPCRATLSRVLGVGISNGNVSCDAQLLECLCGFVSCGCVFVWVCCCLAFERFLPGVCLSVWYRSAKRSGSE